MRENMLLNFVTEFGDPIERTSILKQGATIG